MELDSVGVTVVSSGLLKRDLEFFRIRFLGFTREEDIVCGPRMVLNLLTLF